MCDVCDVQSHLDRIALDSYTRTRGRTRARARRRRGACTVRDEVDRKQVEVDDYPEVWGCGPVVWPVARAAIYTHVGLRGVGGIVSSPDAGVVVYL